MKHTLTPPAFGSRVRVRVSVRVRVRKPMRVEESKKVGTIIT